MSRSQNRADTVKWKEKRKDHKGDKCHLAKCGICHMHKRIGNSTKLDNKKAKLYKVKDDEEWDKYDEHMGDYQMWEELNNIQIEMLEKLKIN